MMLVAAALKVVPVTIHIPLKDVAGALSQGAYRSRRIAITARDLRRYFGIARPRLAVTGLNPHAGEDGGIGPRGDRRHRAGDRGGAGEGLDVTGPHPADTLFHAEARATAMTPRSPCITTRR